jgi:hypothetical protein
MSHIGEELLQKIEAVLPAPDEPAMPAAKIHRSHGFGAPATTRRALRWLERAGRVQSTLVDDRSSGRFPVRLYRKVIA